MLRNTVITILAHVDAGKTTLTESVLLACGVIRKSGRVDHRDTFLDTDAQERSRGITIYAKPAMFTWKGTPFTAIDTPGHTDFAGETERALNAADAAILLVSAPDGVQGHTLTLWKLLETYNVPTFVYVNKMDMPGTDKTKTLTELKARLSPLICDADSEELYETSALINDAALEKYLESGEKQDGVIADAVNARKAFPCVFGSALRHENTDRLLDAVREYARPCADGGLLSARVFKIARDLKGEKLAFVKVTGGTLRVRTQISIRSRMGDAGEEQKVTSIRFYSGEKYTQADAALAGSVCALTGLKNVLAGDAIGDAVLSAPPGIEPVFSYTVRLPEDCDPHTALAAFRELEEEDPLLHVHWEARSQRISVRVMGDVSLEVLTRVLADRYSLAVSFEAGTILYRETVAAPARGCGHYEPLRHYAEVHLLIEPAPRGSGIHVKSAVSTDELDLSWQRLIFTHLTERQFAGVLTGSPLTDVTFTLAAGRAHIKHTEGGDFRQAVYRAVRQGLMGAQNVLLEPWYKLTLALPDECAGRAMTDITRMGGRFEPPVSENGETQLTAYAPVRTANGYQRELMAYAKGHARMTLDVYGYEPCAEQDAIVSALGYDPERDTDNPADSVFCSHGAGTLVKWNEAPAHMHLKPWETQRDDKPAEPAPKPPRGSFDMDKELLAIFERTYGKTERKLFDKRPERAEKPAPQVKVIDIPERPEYLLVDGYNIIFAWEELRHTDIENARILLADILDNYAAHRGIKAVLVFDAYRVKPNSGAREQYGNIEVVYTKQAQTADSYIERLAHDLSSSYRVRVATGDSLEQISVLGSGALRMSADELRREIEASGDEIRRFLSKLSSGRGAVSVGRALADAVKKTLEGSDV